MILTLNQYLIPINFANVEGQLQFWMSYRPKLQVGSRSDAIAAGHQPHVWKKL